MDAAIIPAFHWNVESPGMAKTVNLDALIPREDFEVAGDATAAQLDNADKLKVLELEPSSVLYRLLRKPDFQRTTAHWPPAKVAKFIESFLTGELIPAIILWKSNTSGNIFVIDGAHRLSTLLAWVHDDYGDGTISQTFFEGFIPEEQKEAAKETRNLIGTSVGSYVELKNAFNLSGSKKLYASQMAAGGITLQWVRGDASRAETSFHTINTEQTPIGALEIRLIRDRRCPNALATRAIVRAGTKQHGTSGYSNARKAEIKKLASDIYEDIFIPPLSTPIKTLDLPVAGRSYTSDSIELILDVVEFANKHQSKVGSRDKKRDILKATLPPDMDGAKTVEFLENVKKSLSRIAGDSVQSLGLHPAVYFYGATGRYQPSALLAALGFVDELVQRGQLMKFTDHRAKFEDFLVKNKRFINEIVKHKGSGVRSVPTIMRLYTSLLVSIGTGLTDAQAAAAASKDEKLSFLGVGDDAATSRSRFDQETKSAVFLKTALDQAVRCGICGARLHTKSITIDHKTRRADGGRGSVDNGQPTHPYCNSGYKESKEAKAKSNA